MPLFEIRCKKCGYKMDKLYSSVEEMEEKIKELECPNCKEINVFKRVYNPATEIFRCSGFYKTDYKNKK